LIEKAAFFKHYTKGEKRWQQALDRRSSWHAQSARNYNTMKNKRNNPDRIELMKYCKFCNKETLHKETK